MFVEQLNEIYRRVAGDYTDGHEEGDIGATGKGWQEMNCYLEEPASRFTSSFNSGTSTLPKFDSKIGFQKSNPAFLFLADSPDIVRLLVPLPDSPGSSPGGFSPSFFPPVPPPNRIQTHSVPISSTHISLLCVSLLFLQKRGFILKILLHLFIGTQQFIIIFLKGQTSIQEGIHFNCSISKA